VDIPASLPPSSHVCDTQDCGISGLPELGTATRTKQTWRKCKRQNKTT